VRVYFQHALGGALWDDVQHPHPPFQAEKTEEGLGRHHGDEQSGKACAKAPRAVFGKHSRLLWETVKSDTWRQFFSLLTWHHLLAKKECICRQATLAHAIKNRCLVFMLHRKKSRLGKAG
jgi:hypothetical protein